MSEIPEMSPYCRDRTDVLIQQLVGEIKKRPETEVIRFLINAATEQIESYSISKGISSLEELQKSYPKNVEIKNALHRGYALAFRRLMGNKRHFREDYRPDEFMSLL